MQELKEIKNMSDKKQIKQLDEHNRNQDIIIDMDPIYVTAKPSVLTSREDYKRLGYYANEFRKGNIQLEQIPYRYRSHLKSTREAQQKAYSSLVQTEAKERERYNNSSTGRFTNLLGNVATGVLTIPALSITTGATGVPQVAEAMSTPELLTSYKVPFAAKLATDFLGSTIAGEAVNTAARKTGHNSFGDAIHDVLLPNRANINTFGDNAITSTLEFLNPGYVAGGVGVEYLGKNGHKLFEKIKPLTDKFVNSQVVPQMFNQSVNNTALKPITQFRNRIIPYKAKINREEMLDTFLKAKWDTEHRARISDAERLGIPKGERNNRFKYPKFNTAHTDADFYVIHRTDDVWPVNGDMISFQMGMPKQVDTKTGRQIIQYPMSLHTTFGREVQSHMAGGWDNSKITYLIPYKDMVLFNGYPQVTTPMDTYWISGTRIGMPKNNVRALTHDKKTFLQLKRNGINVTYTPNASDQNFRQKWIEQQSILQGMPINSEPDFVVPKSEILKLHNEYKLAHPNLKIGDRTGISTGVQFYDDVLHYENVPKAHFGHWTFELYHPYNVPKQDFFEGHISSAINTAPIRSTNMNWLDPVAFQGAVKKLGLRKLRLRRMDYDPQYAELVKEHNNWIEEINNLVSGKKYIKYNHGGQIK